MQSCKYKLNIKYTEYSLCSNVSSNEILNLRILDLANGTLTSFKETKKYSINIS